MANPANQERLEVRVVADFAETEESNEKLEIGNRHAERICLVTFIPGGGVALARPATNFMADWIPKPSSHV
jgi:hypothetical protein